ncbi:hypothetical protein [Streptomyces sp. NPDC090021]|uniref:hypothetical protein n=1 Tax=Streptomyces sp. NPDC090021 TaxID=3365919 RepID=UPI0038055C79
MDALQNRGLVTRTPSARDARSVEVALTRPDAPSSPPPTPRGARPWRRSSPTASTPMTLRPSAGCGASSRRRRPHRPHRPTSGRASRPGGGGRPYGGGAVCGRTGPRGPARTSR